MAHIRTAYRASRNLAGMRKGSGGSGDLLDLFLGELASTRPVEYAIVVIVRHEILLSRFWGVFSKHPGQNQKLQNVC
jgi:hypothetical protein